MGFGEESQVNVSVIRRFHRAMVRISCIALCGHASYFNGGNGYLNSFTVNCSGEIYFPVRHTFHCEQNGLLEPSRVMGYVGGKALV